MWFSVVERGLKSPLRRPLRTNDGSSELHQKKETSKPVSDCLQKRALLPLPFLSQCDTKFQGCAVTGRGPSDRAQACGASKFVDLNHRYLELGTLFSFHHRRQTRSGKARDRF